MRLIDADALLKAFSEDIDTDVCQTFADYLSEWGFSHDTVERAITDAPTIEAEPVRHGRWAYIGGDEWCCTNCREVISTEGRWERPLYNYCHECGAKMDGDSHEP